MSDSKSAFYDASKAEKAVEDALAFPWCEHHTPQRSMAAVLIVQLQAANDLIKEMKAK